jgi:hypothetical protein
MILLIRELNDQRYLSSASRIDPGHIENDWVTCFETAQHTLEIRERSDGRTIDAIDHVAFIQRLPASRRDA